MKKFDQYIVMAASGLLVFLSCERDLPLPASGTPIELTVGIVGDPSPQTKTVVTTDAPYGTQATAFGSATSLYMVMKSEKTSASALYSRTLGTVTASAPAVAFDTGHTRFWEDSYSRDAKLSVYAACIPGKATALTLGGSSDYSNNSFAWTGTEVGTTIAWPLSGTSANQTEEGFLANQDLCFSNNVSCLGDDNRIAFNQSTKKFGNGNLIFHHALTWITFKIKRGDGFAGAPFAFSNAGENIVLKGFNTAGTLTLATGEFSSVSTTDITQMALEDHRSEVGPAFDYVLDAYLLPGSLLEGTATGQIYFTLDQNSYHITKNQLQTVLQDMKLSDGDTNALETVSDTQKKMRPGVHYIFELTVSKKNIDKISAKVVPWETVTVDQYTPTNARITVSLLDNGTPKTGTADFDLFRASNVSESINDAFESYNWGTGYTPSANKAILVENVANGGVYTAKEAAAPETEWYWPDNKTFYHFRTILPKTSTGEWEVTADAVGGDYITLIRAAEYRDVCWGAPFYATEGKLRYDYASYGFDGTSAHQISKAIGPTSGTIQMTMFHMMSDVSVQLTTSEGTDAVTLDGATVQFSNTYPTAKVLMGTGLVVPTGDAGNALETVNASHKVEHYGFIPQSLESVVLTITAQNNQYIVDLKDLEVGASAISNTLIANPYSETSPGSGKYKIDRWYPNVQYSYTFKLTKTGIATIMATLANWETVNAGDDNVQII